MRHRVLPSPSHPPASRAKVRVPAPAARHTPVTQKRLRITSFVEGLPRKRAGTASWTGPVGVLICDRASPTESETTVEDALDDAFTAVVTFVPKLLLFLVILIIGVIVARLLAKAVNAILERVGFDRAIERGGVARVMEKSKYDASDILAKIVYYAVLLFTLQLAFSAFGPNPISDLLTAIIAFLPRVFVAIVIVVVASAIAAGVKTLIEGALGGLSYGRVLANIAAVFILGLGIIAALNQVGIATTVTTPVLIAVLATIAGILIVGVGGGLVRPMQSRWESYLTKAEAEAPRIRQEAAMAPSVTEQLRDKKDQMQSDYRSPSTVDSQAPTAVYDQSVGATAYDPNVPATAYDPNEPSTAYDPNRPSTAYDPNQRY